MSSPQAQDGPGWARDLFLSFVTAALLGLAGLLLEVERHEQARQAARPTPAVNCPAPTVYGKF